MRVVPPDPDGDVGGGFYLQMVNTVMAVYDADTGAKVVGPLLMSELFDPATQKLCATHDDGDPIVVYDDHAGQWLISQFGLNFNASRFAECIAVSEICPYRGLERLPVRLPEHERVQRLPEVRGLACRRTTRPTSPRSTSSGAATSATSTGAGPAPWPTSATRCSSATRRGRYTSTCSRSTRSSGDSCRPMPTERRRRRRTSRTSSCSSTPTTGSGGYPDDALEVWEFLVDWTDPTLSTFTNQTTSLTTANFNPWPCRPGRDDCVPQKGSKVLLDSIPDRLMNRLQYRNLGGGDHRMVVNHTVRVPPKRAGVRWYQLTDSGLGGDWEIADQGTFGPDDPKHRWMGSAAMDADGNMAIGYSMSSGSLYPSIAIAGQTVTGSDGLLDLAERKVLTGPGSQKGDYNRWGDYTDMVVAEDGCTFYYTNQYYRKTNQWGWATEVVRFRIDTACV